MNRILHNTAIYDNPNKVIFFISITKTAKLKNITFSILWADIVETSCFTSVVPTIVTMQMILANHRNPKSLISQLG